MLLKKAVYNGLSLELSTPFDFRLRTKSVPLSFCYSKVSNIIFIIHLFFFLLAM